MSGESGPRGPAAHEALERVFGAEARCSACAAAVAGYRVLTVFLHDQAVTRACCDACYDDALAGEYSARGEVLILDFDAFVARFGCPGPRPRPTPLDRALVALMRDPELTGLSPGSECHARRRGAAPFRVTATFRAAGGDVVASALLSESAAVLEMVGDPSACARVVRVLEAARG